MAQSDGQNTETLLTLENGGQCVRRRGARIFTSGELNLDAEMQAYIGSLKDERGRYPNRGFQRVTYDEAFPWRPLARYIVALWRAGRPLHEALGMLAVLDRFACRLWTKRVSQKKAA